MTRLLALLLCALCVISAFTLIAYSGEFSGFPGSANPALQVSRTSVEHTSISLRSPQVVVGTQAVGYENFQTFALDGESVLPAEGNPAVPQVCRFYRIPNTGSVELNLEDLGFDVVENVNALPYHADETDASRNAAVYNADSWYPSQVAVMSAPMQLRDFRVVMVTLYPVQVNPVTHQARVYHTIDVSLIANNQPGVNEITRVRRPSGAWASTYRHLIANLDDSALDDMTTTPGSYLILTNSNATPLPFADSLAEWKTRKGYKVVINSRATWTAQQAITIIRNAYENWDPPLEYVCLIGDPGAAWGIPVDGTNSNFDHSYALGNSGDDLEDIAVGRLSGSNAISLATINAKIMQYERDPYMGADGVADTTWYHRAFLYAGVSRGCAGNWLLMRWAKDQFIHTTGADSAFVTTHATDAVVLSDITTQINRGVGFFLWRGCWIGGMPSTAADNTNPLHRFPITMTLEAYSGAYAASAGVESPAEDFLCAGTPANPKGGVCGIGAANDMCLNPANVCFAAGLVYAIANLHEEHLGIAVATAKNCLFTEYGDMPHPEGGGTIAGVHARLMNLLGEPSLSIWTGVPKVLNVVHPTALNIGDNSVSVAVTLVDNQPVADALVCLWKKSPDSTWVTGLTDASGHLTLPVGVHSAGDMFLTVTKQNCKPYLSTIPCAQADALPMLCSYRLDDDNIGGTQGNNDGNMNPGETIDLPVYLKNFGLNTEVIGISATLSSDNPQVTVINNTATFSDLEPRDSTAGQTAFRIHVGQNLRNHAPVLLTLAVTSSAGQNSGVIPLTCAGAEIAFQHSHLSSVLNPGTSANLSVMLVNFGVVATPAVSAQLASLNPFVQVTQPNASFAAMQPSMMDSNSTPFVLVANPMALRGAQAALRLILSSGDTLQFTVSIGTARPCDPTGPDAYGYYAYDNSDTTYTPHPVFNYVDISTNGGTNLNLNDTGDKSSVTPVWSTARRLPFGFKFYGTVYDTITICSNGWCAFGNQSYIDLFRNYQIPGIGAPDAMIAPYWDDLMTNGTGRGVWVMDDPANHRYIVQWKAQAGTTYATPLDFEIILFDTTYVPTTDGNGRILMQYNVVSMNLPNDANDETPGCTIGIQAPGCTVGLQYAYENSYAAGADTVRTGRAVLFTTEVLNAFGEVEGVVTDAATGQPMPGVQVSAAGSAYQTLTDNTGHYLLPTMLTGVYTLLASAHRFNTDSVANVGVNLNDTTTVNFSLHHPGFELSVTSLHDSIGDGPHEINFNILNPGNGPLDYSTRLVYPEAPNPWDTLSTIAVSGLVGDNQLWGCEYFNDQWWVTGGSGPGGQNELYRFDHDGNYIGSITQPSSTLAGWFDLATDGQYLYGSDGHYIVGIDTNGVARDSVYSPLNPSRAIAYDPYTDHFWVADYTSPISEINRDGVVIQQIPNPGWNISGFGWNAADERGYKLYAFCRNGTSALARVMRMDPITHVSELATDIWALSDESAAGCTVTNLWSSPNVIFGGILRSANSARLEVCEVSFNTSWITFTPAAALIAGGGQQQVTVHFDRAILRSGSYHLNALLSSTVYDSTLVLPISLTVLDWVSAKLPSQNIPTQFALYPAYPNPFNPSTEIGFDLPKAEHVRLEVFNSLGQKVATLVDAEHPAGSYTVRWNGAETSTGLYFCRMQAGRFVQTQKLLLIK